MRQQGVEHGADRLRTRSNSAGQERGSSLRHNELQLKAYMSTQLTTDSRTRPTAGQPGAACFKHEPVAHLMISSPAATLRSSMASITRPCCSSSSPAIGFGGGKDAGLVNSIIACKVLAQQGARAASCMAFGSLHCSDSPAANTTLSCPQQPASELQYSDTAAAAHP